MNNIELIDDYLTNRLSDESKASFEAQVASDPSLKADLAMQRQIIESVKKARATELKAMLGQVQLPAGGSASFGIPVMRMAASIIGAGFLVAAIGYYINTHQQATPAMSTSLEDSLKKVSSDDFEPLEEPTNPESTGSNNIEQIKSSEKVTTENEKKITQPIAKNTPPQPKIEAIDPTRDMLDGSNNALEKEETNKPSIVASHIAVEVEETNRKYQFHYQFNKGNLLLYGKFDKALYEVLEINGEKHSVFLFYKDNYYSLDETETKITVLEPIKNELLVKKLKEYKGR
jgi:hypothetical protein